MDITLVAALGQNNGIGLGNKLPWHLPSDLQHFKAVTKGKPMLMGRKTFQSLPGLLPGRKHIVLSRSAKEANREVNREGRTEQVKWIKTLDEALQESTEELMVIGGAEIYKLCLPIATRLILTRVHATPQADVFFPAVDFTQWKLANSKHVEEDALPYTVETYHRP